MDEHCINCGNLFEKRKKGFRRKSIDTLTKDSSVSIRNVIEGTLNVPITPDKKLFMCDHCAAVCVKVHNSSSTKKAAVHEFKFKKSATSYLGKRRFSSTPCKSAMFASPLKKCPNVASPIKNRKKKAASFVEKAVSNLRESKYYTCFKLLIKKSKSAKEGFLKCIKHFVNEEVKALTDTSLFCLSKVNEETLNNFNWPQFINEIEANVPTLSCAVKGALSSKRTTNYKLSCDDSNIGALVPAYGFTLSNLLHLRLPKFSFLQEVVSVEMYRSGCNQKLFTWFNKLGICRSNTATRNLIDRLCLDFDKRIKTWKTNIQHDMGNFEPNEPEVVDHNPEEISNGSSQMTELYNSQLEGDSMSDSLSNLSDIPLDDNLEGIVPLLESSTIQDDDHVDYAIADIFGELEPGYSFCWDNVQKLSVSRHSAKNQNNMLLWALCFASRNRISFRHLADDNITTKATAISLEHFLPSDDDWKQLRGRMEIVTQRILQKNFQAFGEANIQMHIEHAYSKESKMKSEIVNLGVLKENPSSCRGVIEIMKFLHKYVPSDPNGDPFKIVCHGDQLSIERMVDAKLAMAASELPNDKLIGLIPRPQNFHKRCIILQDSMNTFFSGKSAASKGSLFQIKNKFGFRGVKQKISDCVNDCVDLWNLTTEGYICLLACKLCNITSLDDCPEELEGNDITDFVKRLGKDIVDIVWPTIDYSDVQKCTGVDTTLPYTEAEVDETFAYWEDEEDNPEDNVHDSDSDDEISVSGSSLVRDNKVTDHVYEYSCALTWHGLKLMAERDAERENDGDAIISQWRLDMIPFWNNNHYKYLILGHRLLSAINGWATEQIKQELIWNSTANMTGKEGGNLALDLVNEFMNNDFKTNLKNCHGQYSENQVSRCSKICGSLGKGVEEVFSNTIINKLNPKSKTSGFSDSIQKFITLHVKENLFQRSCKTRYHKGFEGFVNSIGLKDPQNLTKRLTKYAIGLEREKYVCGD